MHKRLLLPLLLGPLLISAGPSSAEPRLQSRVESFDVSGATVDTISASWPNGTSCQLSYLLLKLLNFVKNITSLNHHRIRITSLKTCTFC